MTREHAGTGSLTVAVAGSELTVNGPVLIGVQQSQGGISGEGSVSVRNHGVLNATRVLVGADGLLNGNGTIKADVTGDASALRLCAGPAWIHGVEKNKSSSKKLWMPDSGHDL